SQRLHDEIRYVKDMGLNTIRLEGKLETEEFYQLTDSQGILVMAGWCCCDFWERWPRWQAADFEIAKQSLRDQMYRLRSHPSMGPAVPPVESIRAMVGKDHMWPIDDVWNYHAGGGEFKTINVFSEALANRYGKSDNVDDFAIKSQMQTYEGVRAMYEAYSRNKYQATGVIQWMLNNAWPSMIWHLYDYYLRPGGGYFGTKKACEPVHVQYSYDDRSIVVVNDTQKAVPGLKVRARLLDLSLAEKLVREATVDLPADGVVRAFPISVVEGL